MRIFPQPGIGTLGKILINLVITTLIVKVRGMCRTSVQNSGKGHSAQNSQHHYAVSYLLRKYPHQSRPGPKHSSK